MISLTSPVETAAHHWPAGRKLALLCGATLVLFAVQSLGLQALILCGVVVLYALPGVQFAKAGAARLRVLWPFVLLIIVWHAVIGDLAGGLALVLRMLSAVALANLVTMTTRLSDMMGVMRWMLAPLARLGFPVRRAELAAALMIRFAPVLAEKGRLLTLAWHARSARRPGWRVLIPFAVVAIDDAEHVAEALRARGGI
ncbi:Cobalt transport protein [Sulfitobacter noctilucae]|uniref:energy-coupling factor transporter transmembrane component T family protein n=1 Tax=Sulfitobacter noctilucae TaxID=1342302 RepID=UPI00046A67B4|nr:energy-coupling factor transporter transmembrane component T [Sulfitobacter noctilucae]KIN65379.1 Cobalt transport protein [Sulfitobacter noctilucae]